MKVSDFDFELPHELISFVFQEVMAFEGRRQLLLLTSQLHTGRVDLLDSHGISPCQLVVVSPSF